MRFRPRHVLVLGCLLAAASLPAQATRPLRVLFLGNSLTAGNDVPWLVQGLAELQGVNLQYDVRAPGGYAIEDHWRDGYQAMLATGNYDVVILQQGPSTLAESQANLRQWTVTWAAEARRFGTRPALYMIWPVRTQTNGFALVSQSYRNAALAADAAVFPAGEAWQQALLANPSLALYEDDDLHATPTGSFLAAMVIARGLFSLDPTRVPTRVRTTSVSSAALTTFRSVVESLPPSSLSAESSGSSSGSSTTPTTPTPTPPTPAASAAGSGGGGAPSGWFFLALLAIGAARASWHKTGRLA